MEWKCVQCDSAAVVPCRIIGGTMQEVSMPVAQAVLKHYCLL